MSRDNDRINRQLKCDKHSSQKLHRIVSDNVHFFFFKNKDTGVFVPRHFDWLLPSAYRKKYLKPYCIHRL